MEYPWLDAGSAGPCVPSQQLPAACPSCQLPGCECSSCWMMF